MNAYEVMFITNGVTVGLLGIEWIGPAERTKSIPFHEQQWMVNDNIALTITVAESTKDALALSQSSLLWQVRFSDKKARAMEQINQMLQNA